MCPYRSYNYVLGIGHFIARHIAHLFIRDPISLFAEKVEQNDETDTDHFEVLFSVIVCKNEIRQIC